MEPVTLLGITAGAPHWPDSRRPRPIKDCQRVLPGLPRNRHRVEREASGRERLLVSPGNSSLRGLAIVDLMAATTCIVRRDPTTPSRDANHQACVRRISLRATVNAKRPGRSGSAPLIETDRFALCHRSGFNAYEDDTITRAGGKHGTSKNQHDDQQDPRPSAPFCELPCDDQAAR
jgi:hypothetical protein